MSSAGSFLDWLASVGADPSVLSLLEKALRGRRAPTASPPSAGWEVRGLRGGATTHGPHSLGLSPEHTLGDMAAGGGGGGGVRGRPLPASGRRTAVAVRPASLAMAGGSASGDVARRTGRGDRSAGARGRRSGLAAAAGAALVAGGHRVDLEMELVLDRMDPAENEVVPDPSLVERYQTIRPVAERVA